jgi:hypothetical protein
MTGVELDVFDMLVNVQTQGNGWKCTLCRIFSSHFKDTVRPDRSDSGSIE